MSHQTVKQAAIAGVKAVLDQGSYAVAWENKQFTPPSGLWLAVHYLPVNTVSATLGSSGEDEVRALVQVDVNVPADSGTKAQTDALSSLESAFQAGTVLSKEGQTVTVVRASRSSGRLVERHWRVSLTVEIYGRYQRSVA